MALKHHAAPQFFWILGPPAGIVPRRPPAAGRFASRPRTDASPIFSTTAAPAQPTVIWACQLRKDDDFDGAFMFMCKCFSRRGWVSMMVSCNCPAPTRHLRLSQQGASSLKEQRETTVIIRERIAFSQQVHLRLQSNISRRMAFFRSKVHLRSKSNAKPSFRESRNIVLTQNDSTMNQTDSK